jgi:DNA-binding PadR family transcriptional regulator
LRYYAARSILAAMTPRPRTDEAAGGRSNDPPVLILTSLADGEKHGYALLQDIEAFAGVRLGPGTLYGAISRLEERGLIQAAAASGRRRPYRLTAAGAEALRGALADLRTIVDEGSARLARRPAPVALHGGVTA